MPRGVRSALRRAPLCALLACAGLASACATLGKVPLEPSRPFQSEVLTEQNPLPPSPDKVFSVSWRRALLEPEFMEWKPREFTRPAVDDSGRVYVATRDGFIRCFDSEGAPLWERKVKGPFYGAIELDGDTLIVPSADGLLLALSTRDGSEKWRYRTGEELGSRPVVANGLVYVVSFANTVYALDAETGAWKWQYRRESSSEFAIRGVSTPVIDFDKLFVGFSDGMSVALDATDGTVKWSRKLSAAAQFPDLIADPQLDEKGHVIFASFASGLFSLDEETGAILWAKPFSGATALLVSGDTLFAGSASGLSARTLDAGLEKWKLPLAEGWSGPMTLAGPYLLVPTSQALLFVDRRSGRPQRHFNPGRGVSAPPAFSRGELYVLSNYGYLYALSLTHPGKG